jgi:hypothetical protein
MDYNKLDIIQLKALVKVIKKIYFSNITSLSKKDLVMICEKFKIPASNIVDVLKKVPTAPDEGDSEYDF